MKLNIIGKALVAMVVIVSLSSCRHKDLYMEESLSSELEVVFDWRYAPEANPSSMALYLFDNNGQSPMRFIFDNRDGGLIKAPFGTCHALYMNGDNTDWAHLRNNEDIENMEVYTSDAVQLSAQNLNSSAIPRSEDAGSERMAVAPGMLWASRTNNIDIAPHSGKQTITLYPREAVCHYIVDIYDVDNLEGVKSSDIDATISGMAEGYSLGAQSSTEPHVTMTFTLQAQREEDRLHGEFLTFGESPTNSARHSLTVYMVLTDGSKWWHSFDVTDQVTNAPDPRHVHIILRGLPLPEPPADNSGAGINPDVNEWQPVYIDMHM